MKYLVRVVLLSLFFSSCSREMHMTGQAMKHSRQLEVLAAKLFVEHDTASNLLLKDLEPADRKALKHPLRCNFVQLLHYDSLVIFTRMNMLFREDNIIIDLRHPVRDSIPAPARYEKFYPLKKGMYYSLKELSLS